MSGLFFSRIKLKRDPAIDALARQLLPDDKGDRAHAAHRLVWSLFAGDSERKRDFLFRDMATGKGLSAARTSFLVLSQKAPNREHPLLDIETQTFAPLLKVGDHLGFSLRANPVRQSGAKGPGGKTIRHDVVMHALHDVSENERAAQRPVLVRQAGYQWLCEQADRSGFHLLAQPAVDSDEEDDAPLLRIDGYEQWRFARLGRKGRISVLEYDGVLKVTDPDLLLARIATGFGRARAFGCGLMLIRRV